jgi:hypothetical protein
MPRHHPHSSATGRRLVIAALIPSALGVGLVLLLALLFASILGVGPIALGGCTAAPGAGASAAESVQVLDPGGRPPGSVDATALDAWIARRRPASPLVGLGPAFVAAGDEFGVDPLLLVAIAAAESGFGTAGSGVAARNAFGLGPGIAFSS